MTVGNYCWNAFLHKSSTVTDLTAAKTSFALERFSSCLQRPIAGQKSIWKLGIWDTRTLWKERYNGTIINRPSLIQHQYCNKSLHKHIFIGGCAFARTLALGNSQCVVSTSGSMWVLPTLNMWVIDGMWIVGLDTCWKETSCRLLWKKILRTHKWADLKASLGSDLNIYWIV